MIRKHYYIIAVMVVIPLMYFGSIAMAGSQEDFVRPFGLLVHEGNKDEVVMRGKTLEILLKYFALNRTDESDVLIKFKDVDKNSPAYPYVKRACRQRIINCGKNNFYPNKAVSQRDFLEWFYALYSIDNPEFLAKKYPNIKFSYIRAWIHARRSNFLIGSKITYDVLKEFLYRFEVSRLHDGQSYFDGLVLNEKDINEKHFRNIDEVRDIENKLQNEIQNLKGVAHTAAAESRLIRRYSAYRDKFIDVEQKLIELNSPLHKIKNLPDDIAQQIEKNDINEILGKFTYNYSHNPAYRKYNVVEGAKTMSGRLLMPGESADYLDALRKRGWGHFKYGWTIVGGKEKWEFGGGLSGSSTMISLPSWLAGLELTKFSPHNIYYVSLYPKEYIGLDTTLYRPYKNLIIKNTTNSPVLFYVADDKEKQELTVYVLGNSPFKNYKVEGPIKIGNKTFKWTRQGERLDGTMFYDERITHYWSIK